jgi:HEAT repeat protein
VLDALFGVLDADSNVNVRLAAVDALVRFASESDVHRRLLHSLAVQRSPIVQIELIDLLVETSQKDSAGVLRELSVNAEVDRAVREHATWGLGQL